MQYQGILADTHGSPTTNGSVQATFNIYSDQYGGYPIVSLPTTLSVQNGYFSTILSGLFAGVFSMTSNRYIEAVFDGQGTGSRTQIGAVPYALHAYAAEDWANVPSSLGAGPALVVDDNGRVGIGVTTPSYTLDVSGDVKTKFPVLRGSPAVFYLTSGFNNITVAPEINQVAIMNFTVGDGAVLNLTIGSDPPSPCSLTLILANHGSGKPVINFIPNPKIYAAHFQYPAPDTGETQVYDIFFNGTDYLVHTL